MNKPSDHFMLQLTEKARQYLDFLCVQPPTRRVGTQGNQEVTAFAADVLHQIGCE